jgi:hypothetical protein
MEPSNGAFSVAIAVMPVVFMCWLMWSAATSKPGSAAPSTTGGGGGATVGGVGSAVPGRHAHRAGVLLLLNQPGHRGTAGLQALGAHADEEQNVLVQGYNTALSVVTSRYMLALQHQRGTPLDTAATALRTACLTGIAQCNMASQGDPAVGQQPCPDRRRHR